MIKEIDQSLDKKFRQGFHGALAAARENGNRQLFPLLACSLRGGGALAGSLYRVREGCVQGVGPEGCLRQFPYPLVAIVCRGHGQVPCWCCHPPAFAPGSSEVAVKLSGLSVSPSPDLLQLYMYVSYFQSLMVYLYFVA